MVATADLVPNPVLTPLIPAWYQVIVLGTMAHPNIVELIGVSCSDTARCLMYELMEGGSLADRLAFCDDGEDHATATSVSTLLHEEGHSYDGANVDDAFLMPFRWQERIQVIVDGCLGLSCLHECTLLHCDIKPENILIRGNGRAAVADFGLSRSLDGASYGGSFGFTPGYADPHWKVEKKYTEMSDIYAMGITILQVSQRFPP